mgnify:CR=1 FL=1
MRAHRGHAAAEKPFLRDAFEQLDEVLRRSPASAEDVRALGLSACSQCARVGGFVSPLLLLIDESSATVPYAIWAALALAAGVATLALPETLGEPSIESVAELRQLMARQLGAGLAP